MTKFFYSLFISIALMGCVDPNKENEDIKLPPQVASGVTIHADQVETEIRFDAVAHWTATITNMSGEPWGFFSPEQGSAGEQMIKLRFLPNYSGAERSFELQIHCSGSTTTIGITQKHTTQEGEDNAIAIIPDEAFRAYLVANFDVNQDGKMQVDEMQLIRDINIGNPEIKSLEGIEYCSILSEVVVSNSSITLFDFSHSEILGTLRLTAHRSKSVKIVSPHITGLSLGEIPSGVEIDLSQCTAIANLSLYRTDLLDLSKFPNLNSLTLQELPSAIASLDLSQFADMEVVDIMGIAIESLVIRNPKLRAVYFDNIKTPSIDLSQSASLEYVYFRNKFEVSNINLGNFKPELTNDDELATFEIHNKAENFTLIAPKVEEFVLNGTKVKNLNLDGCGSLVELVLRAYSFEGEYPNITVIEGQIKIAATQSLERIIGGSAYNLLDISSCPAVGVLMVRDLRATSFKLIPPASLTDVTIRDSSDPKNAPRTIDLTNCTGIKKFECTWMNGLKEIDLSGCVSLENANVNLGAHERGLSKLNFDGCSSLEAVMCPVNGIEELGLAGCNKLIQLDCSGNKIKTLDLSHCNIYNDVYVFPDFYPLKCKMSTLETLYLKTGWQINGINKFRNDLYIDPTTNILYK